MLVSPSYYTATARIRVLSFDGGGARGLSSLLILRELMERLAFQSGATSRTSRPCDVFDLIVGTGTGAISALFLGRMKMSIEEAIEEYVLMTHAAFRSPSSLSSFIPGDPPFNCSALEGHLRKTASLHFGDPEALLSDINSLDPSGCRTVVLAATSKNADGAPHLFRTYSFYPPFKIVEVALAASATKGLFLPVSIGHPPVKFLDASAIGYNNPIEIALAEASEIWPGRNVDVCISLGAGLRPIVPGSAPISDAEWNQFAELSEQLIGTSQMVHERVNRYSDLHSKSYFRFSVDEDLESIDLDEWKAAGNRGPLQGATDGYLRRHETDQDLNSCVHAIVGTTGFPNPASQSHEERREIPNLFNKNISYAHFPAAQSVILDDTLECSSETIVPRNKIGSLLGAEAGSNESILADAAAEHASQITAFQSESASPTRPRRIRILSLDGKVTSGLSSLLILREVMSVMQQIRGTTLEDPRPCDYFDLIIGNGTGGISALLLGRLHLTLGETVGEYIRMVDALFQSPWRVASQRLFDNEVLENYLRRTIAHYLGDPEALLFDSTTLDPLRCRTAVLADARAGLDHLPSIFRSYSSDSNKLVDVAQATFAAASQVSVVSFNHPAVEFFEPSCHGHHTSTELALSEAQKIWPDHEVDFVLAIGTDTQHIIDARRDGITRLSQLPMENRECFHDQALRTFGPTSQAYFRFSINPDLGEIGTEEWKEAGNLDRVVATTNAYLRNEEVGLAFSLCARKIAGITSNLNTEEQRAHASQTDSRTIASGLAALPLSRIERLNPDALRCIVHHIGLSRTQILRTGGFNDPKRLLPLSSTSKSLRAAMLPWIFHEFYWIPHRRNEFLPATLAQHVRTLWVVAESELDFESLDQAGLLIAFSHLHETSTLIVQGLWGSSNFFTRIFTSMPALECLEWRDAPLLGHLLDLDGFAGIRRLVYSRHTEKRSPYLRHIEASNIFIIIHASQGTLEHIEMPGTYALFDLMATLDFPNLHTLIYFGSSPTMGTVAPTPLSSVLKKMPNLRTLEVRFPTEGTLFEICPERLHREPYDGLVSHLRSLTLFNPSSTDGLLVYLPSTLCSLSFTQHPYPYDIDVNRGGRSRLVLGTIASKNYSLNWPRLNARQMLSLLQSCNASQLSELCLSVTGSISTAWFIEIGEIFQRLEFLELHRWSEESDVDEQTVTLNYYIPAISKLSRLRELRLDLHLSDEIEHNIVDNREVQRLHAGTFAEQTPSLITVAFLNVHGDLWGLRDSKPVLYWEIFDVTRSQDHSSQTRVERREGFYPYAT